MNRDISQGAVLLLVATAMCYTAQGCSKEAAKKPDENNARFHRQLLDIAADYNHFMPYDETPRIADSRCAFSQGTSMLSKSKDSGTHGQKVYYLYAKDMASYIANEKAPDGQWLVKESFLPIPLPVATVPHTGDLDAKPVSQAKEEFEAGEKYGLFIMMRLAPGSEGYQDTDDGWIYGTVTADGQTVTSAGKVHSCMSCHLQAPHDRLFGVPKNQEQNSKIHFKPENTY